MTALEIKTIDASSLERVFDIDRSESVNRLFRRVGNSLEAYEAEREIASGPGFWQSHLPLWKQEIDAGAFASAAFDGEKMAGLSILKAADANASAEILALYVSAEYRMSGIAKSLYMEMERAAKKSGVKSLFVQTSPTASAVGFYLSQGFELAPAPQEMTNGDSPETLPMLKRL